MWQSKLENRIRIQKDLSKLKKLFCRNTDLVVNLQKRISEFDDQKLNISYQPPTVAIKKNSALGCENRNIFWDTWSIFSTLFPKILFPKKIFLSNIILVQ